MGWEYYLSDAWWVWVWHNFAVSIGLGFGLLKILAIVHPGTKTNQIVDLISGLVFRSKERGDGC